MTGQPLTVEADNARSLNTLIRAITLPQDQFALILVRCNYTQLRNRIVQQLHERCPIPLHELALPESAKTLYTTIQTELQNGKNGTIAKTEESHPPQALMVFGLESVAAIDQVLVATNIVREELRKNFPFPLVLWVNDRVLYKLDRLAPDLKSWAGNAIIQFELAIPDLVRSLKDHTERLFTNLLDSGDIRFSPNWAIVPKNNALRQAELEFALNDIHNSGNTLEPDLQANLDFLLGQDAHAQGELETAHECYERSLTFWQAEAERQQALHTSSASLTPHPSPVEREACILIYLGLWWRSYAVLQRSAYLSACRMARAFFKYSLRLFEEANRQDLVAKFVIVLAEVLQKLAQREAQQWTELERVAKKALVLHQLYPDPVRQARDHGFLAEVALARSNWAAAKQEVEMALRLLEQAEQEVEADHPPHLLLENSLEISRRYHCGWYFLLRARAEEGLDQIEQAIAHLESALDHSPDSDPPLHIQILQTLRRFYFQQGEYLKAFQTRQASRSLEQQYGFRAFVGALRLEPQRHLMNPMLEQIDPQVLLAQEIRASGRLRDVERLLARMGRNDYKLTVIHGPSGVGKSSIVSAGLAPALKERLIGDRTAFPIVLNVYTDWITLLDRSLAPLLNHDSRQFPATAHTVIELLRQATDRNHLPVLIFDQFEEFFFVYPQLLDRRPFYHFLRDCLNLPFVKVVLSLREDYLHYLLEMQRLTDLSIIDNDILSKDIRYPLGDFSPEDATSVIKSLTNQAQFYLDDDLVDELVRDLAGELGEVRPIELQVVGAQLQAENITTLAQYRKHGPKEKLVARSLESVVEDCGPENEAAARIVLFLLTHENGSRPLKTRAELEADLMALDLMAEIDKLDLVLEVLVGSGLVFLVPEIPDDRYQLVHDYLVSFIRQQGQGELFAELEQERERRQLSEDNLSEILQLARLTKHTVQILENVILDLQKLEQDIPASLLAASLLERQVKALLFLKQEIEQAQGAIHPIETYYANLADRQQSRDRPELR